MTVVIVCKVKLRWSQVFPKVVVNAVIGGWEFVPADFDYCENDFVELSSRKMMRLAVKLQAGEEAVRELP